MASVPDMSQMMAETNKPSKSETIQNKLGAEAEADFMRNSIGTAARPGTARLLSTRIDQMTSPEKLSYQRGRLNSGVQQSFDGAGLLRNAALARSSGTGVGNAALRTGFLGLNTALSSGQASIGTKARQTQEQARVGFDKMGQGMMDNVVSGLGQLGDIESSALAAKIKAGEAAAQRSLDTQKGYMELGANVMGQVSGAASNSFDKQGNFDMQTFGKKLGGGLTGGLMGGK